VRGVIHGASTTASISAIRFEVALGRAVHQHHGRTLPERVEGDLARRGPGALRQLEHG
jgi:hypothetical protein